MVRHRIVFTGRVQGVGFRATARHIASRRTVTGWVRNEPDGSVLMEVQGEAAVVRAVVQDLKDRMARFIKHADESPIEPAEGEIAFEIRR